MLHCRFSNATQIPRCNLVIWRCRTRKTVQITPAYSTFEYDSASRHRIHMWENRSRGRRLSISAETDEARVWSTTFSQSGSITCLWNSPQGTETKNSWMWFIMLAIVGHATTRNSYCTQNSNNIVMRCYASLYSFNWDFLLSQINIWTTTTLSNVWVVLPNPSWYEFLIGFLIWTPASNYLHLTMFILQYLCDFIHVLIFANVSKCW